jgi:hypothetical protein
MALAGAVSESLGTPPCSVKGKVLPMKILILVTAFILIGSSVSAAANSWWRKGTAAQPAQVASQDKKSPTDTPKDKAPPPKEKDAPKDKKPDPKLTPVKQLERDADAAVKNGGNLHQIPVPARLTDCEFDRVCTDYKKQEWRARKQLGAQPRERYLLLEK